MDIKEKFPILLVEDNKHDVTFVKRAWKINKITNPLFVVPHGEACLQFLRNEGKYSDPEKFPRPGIILMDIQMPVMDGIECLGNIKKDEQLKTIPVIMLTTSDEEIDRIRSYQIGCNTFIKKPVNFDKFTNAIREIQIYWTLSELPQG